MEAIHFKKKITKEIITKTILALLIIGIVCLVTINDDDKTAIRATAVIFSVAIGIILVEIRYKELKNQSHDQISSINWNSSVFPYPLSVLKIDCPKEIENKRIRISLSIPCFDRNLNPLRPKSYILILYKNCNNVSHEFFYLLEQLDPHEYEYDHYSKIVNSIIRLFEESYQKTRIFYFEENRQEIKEIGFSYYGSMAVDIKCDIPVEEKIYGIFDEIL